MQRVSYLHSLCWRKKNRIQLPWLQINDYQFQRFRKDRNKYEGGKCLFIRQGLITKRLPKFETKVAERICVELTICKITRLPQNNELKTFFEEINLSLFTLVNEYDYIILIGDLNLNTKSKYITTCYYSNLRDTYDFTNLIKANTYFKSSNQSSIYVILINWSKSFQGSGIVITGLSDCHKMILTFFRSYFPRCSPKTTTHRSFRYFETKVSYMNWQASYSPKSVTEGLNMIT